MFLWWKLLTPHCVLSHGNAEVYFQQDAQRIRNTVAELEDLENHKDSRNTPSQDGIQPGKLKQLGEIVSAEDSPSPPINRVEGSVVCIPGLGLLDETVAMPLAQLLRREGISAEAKDSETLSISKLFALDLKDVGLICVCYLECRHFQRNGAGARQRSATAPRGH